MYSTTGVFEVPRAIIVSNHMTYYKHVLVEVERVRNCGFQFETMSTPTDSPESTPIQPLHNPSLAAQVVVPQAPIGNGSVVNQAPGMGAKALLAKKLVKNQ